MSEKSDALLRKRFDFSTWVAKRALEAVQNKALVEKIPPAVVALGLTTALQTLLRNGGEAFREAGYWATAERFETALRELASVERAMRILIRDETLTEAGRAPTLSVAPVASLSSVVVGMTETPPEGDA